MTKNTFLLLVPFGILALAHYCRTFQVPVLPGRGVSTKGFTRKSHLFSSPGKVISTAATKSNQMNECRFCSKSFSSRNALFRHLRFDPVCFKAASGGNISAPHVPHARQQIAFKIAYHSTAPNIASREEVQAPEAEIAGNRLAEAFAFALQLQVQDEFQTNSAETKVLSSTQTSIANQRHKSLSQEVGVAAAGDVIIVSFMAPKLNGSHSFKRLVERTEQILSHQGDRGVNLHVVAFKDLKNESCLHAEISCTQKVYHYLMPIVWLPGGNSLQEWWLNDLKESNHSVVGRNTDTLQELNRTFSSQPPSDALRIFSNALRRAESVTLSNRRVRRKSLQPDSNKNTVSRSKHHKSATHTIKLARGRFGALAKKERRAWHNFADPTLRGSASPNQKPVWKVLDRARIHGFLKREYHGKEEIILILEFRGDDFLHQQIRRIVGAALAMTLGWLPEDFFDIATKPHAFTETPIAPGGRLYLKGAKFHFYESLAGQNLFEEETIEGKEQFSTTCTHQLQKALLEVVSTRTAIDAEEQWLIELKDSVAPRICAQLCADSKGINAATQDLKSIPEVYKRTLHLLRGIVSSNTWPDTSVARSSVIYKTDSTSPHAQSSGSFTVINPKFDFASSYPLPLGNELFPELVSAVFRLEEELSLNRLLRADMSGKLSPSSSKKRSPSSHCAINCNAQFTPHVDSGRGAGQSLSMIVGLGDYIEGQLAIEGTSHDIRYRPLEFDGWSCRHWTNIYQGERFSLVWFTPKSVVA